MELFELEGSCRPMQWTGTPTARSGCSEHGPAQNGCLIDPGSGDMVHSTRREGQSGKLIKGLSWLLCVLPQSQWMGREEFLPLEAGTASGLHDINTTAAPHSVFNSIFHLPISKPPPFQLYWALFLVRLLVNSGQRVMYHWEENLKSFRKPGALFLNPNSLPWSCSSSLTKSEMLFNTSKYKMWIQSEKHRHASIEHEDKMRVV